MTNENNTPGASKAAQAAVWGMLALVAALVTFMFVKQGGFKRRTANYPVIATVSPFTLTNQLGATATLDNLLGQVWVADVIFTRCGGPCPELTARMRTLQANLPAGAKLVTITTDPEYDTAAVMKRYAEKFSADPARWLFLTGSAAEIARLAVTDLKFTALAKDEEQQVNPQDLFIHSTTFMIVDKKGQVRAAVEALEPFGVETTQKIVSELLKEP